MTKRNNYGAANNIGIIGMGIAMNFWGILLFLFMLLIMPIAFWVITLSVCSIAFLAWWILFERSDIEEEKQE